MKKIVFIFCTVFIPFITPNNVFSEDRNPYQVVAEKSRFSKYDSPRLNMNFDRIDFYNGLRVPFYNFSLQNMPLEKGDSFEFLMRDGAGNIRKISDAQVNSNLKVTLVFPVDRNVILEHLKTCTAVGVVPHTCPLEEYQFVLGLYSPGESVDFILMKDDYSDGVAAHIVLFPLEAKSESGQKISVELRELPGSYYECIGEGYLPNEHLKTVAQTDDHVSLGCINANEDGNFIFGVKPYMAGKSEGYGTITVKRQNGESLTVEYPWGDKNIEARYID